MAEKLTPKLPAVKGSAPIVQVGHTTGSRYGQDARAKTRGGNRNGAMNESIK
jgi:hypothetical protein